jgi:hypothetical protein
MTGQADWFDGDYGNRLSIGGIMTNGEPNTAIFKPEEVWNLDTKLDDGKPGRGKLVVFPWPACSNAANSAATGADYALTNTGNVCTIHFARAF